MYGMQTWGRLLPSASPFPRAVHGGGTPYPREGRGRAANRVLCDRWVWVPLSLELRNRMVWVVSWWAMGCRSCWVGPRLEAVGGGVRLCCFLFCLLLLLTMTRREPCLLPASDELVGVMGRARPCPRVASGIARPGVYGGCVFFKAVLVLCCMGVVYRVGCVVSPVCLLLACLQHSFARTLARFFVFVFFTPHTCCSRLSCVSSSCLHVYTPKMPAFPVCAFRVFVLKSTTLSVTAPLCCLYEPLACSVR